MTDALKACEMAYENDRNGREAEAIVHYRRALELGIDGHERRKVLLGLGSSLRNVGEHDESVRVLEQAVEESPSYLPLRAFLCLSLSSAGQSARAVAAALHLAIAHAPMDGYERVLKEYCDDLVQ